MSSNLKLFGGELPVDKNARRMTPAILFGLAIFMLLVLPGCNQAEEPGLSPTLTALHQKVAVTATNTEVAQVVSEKLATAQVQATNTSQAIAATQTIQSDTLSQEKLQTATVAAPILAELPKYGLDTSSGQVGWLHNPLTLELTAYHDYKVGNDFMGVTAKDFVWAADITWNTQYGGSGCGLMFRSNGDQNKPNQYMVLITRFSNGRVLFTAVADGDLANYYDIYLRDKDRSFKAENDTTNHLTIVARGNLIDIYTNLVKVGTVDTTQPPVQPGLPSPPAPPLDKKNQNLLNQYLNLKKEYDDLVQQAQSQYQQALSHFKAQPAIYTDGFLAMMAVSESGKTTCTFTNAWLWLLDAE